MDGKLLNELTDKQRLGKFEQYKMPDDGNSLSQEADDKCYFCNRPYYTVAEQKAAGVVFCPNPEGRIACSECWDDFMVKLKGVLTGLGLDDVLEKIGDVLGDEW